ncbi:hypothetical protein BY458DRAFT_520566 [Sporodiniella umbellata]|nr:hypothetical protein BY458DRAFT_520566 [Sporodiniella umbellata]
MMSLEMRIRKLNEQNSEIIKHNVKLNQKLTKMEKTIFMLQIQNLSLKMKNRKLENKSETQEKSTAICLDILEAKEETIQAVCPTKAQKVRASCLRTRRASAHKVSYTLPSVKSKLRKGDPYTFGNGSRGVQRQKGIPEHV